MKTPMFIFNDKCEVKSRGLNGRGEMVDTLLASSVPIRISKSSKSVQRPDGSVVVSKAKAMFPESTNIEAGNVVICGGVEYTVLDMMPIPALIGYAHKEAELG